MDRRFRYLAAVAAVAAPVAITLTLFAQSSDAPPPSPWTGRTTAAGHPDFEGHWTNDTYTPLERPEELGEKAVFTPEEAAAFFQSRVDELNAQADDDIHYDDAIWQAENYTKVAHLRTSLIDRAQERQAPGADCPRSRDAAETARRPTRHVCRQRRQSFAGRTLHLVG